MASGDFLAVFSGQQTQILASFRKQFLLSRVVYITAFISGVIMFLPCQSNSVCCITDTNTRLPYFSFAQVRYFREHVVCRLFGKFSGIVGQGFVDARVIILKSCCCLLLLKKESEFDFSH